MKNYLKLAAGICVAGIIQLSSSCEEQPSQGKMYYDVLCANCHQADGKGLGTLYPPIAGSDWLIAKKDTLPCIIYNGLEGPITVNGIQYNHPMPAHHELDIPDITNIINYINTSFGNNLPTVTHDEVLKIIEQCPQ